MLDTTKKLFMLSSLLFLSACSTETIHKSKSEIESTSEIIEAQEKVTVNVKDEKSKTENNTIMSDKNIHEYQKIYDELSGKSFIFSSGAGAWQTSFTFMDSGEFYGKYSDANGPEVEVSEFVGQFDIYDQVDEFTYRLVLNRFEVTSETGKEERDGEMTITYVDEPHGFPSGSHTFELYLPFKPKSEVSDEYLSWVYGQANNGREFLNSFGLYNLKEEFGMEELIE